jgi:hypothetical protein
VTETGSSGPPPIEDETSPAAPAHGESGTPAPDPASGEEALPTLQEEFAELTPGLQRSMFGKPAQLVTGLLIGAVLLVALLIGLTTFARQGAAPGSAGSAPAVSATP